MTRASGVMTLCFVAACGGATTKKGDAGSHSQTQADGAMAPQDGASVVSNDGSTDGAMTTNSDAAADLAHASDAGSTNTVWRPFAATSPWNTAIAATPSIDPGSATMITDFSTISGQTTMWINIQSYSVPVVYVDSKTQALVTVSASLGATGFRGGATSDGTVPGTGPAPIPSGSMPATGTDKHLSIVDKTANMEWGFWNANDGSSGWTAGTAATLDLSGSGVRTPTSNNPWWAGQGPRACGFGVIAGLITVDEMKAGVIEHALVLAYPHIRSRYYTPPASSAQGTTGEAMSTRGILCGGHIQLDPTIDVTTLGLSKSGVVIARALQKYGAFIGDLSGAVSIYADASPTAQAYWSGGVLSNSDAAKIPLAKFRVLTLGMQYDNNN